MSFNYNGLQGMDVYMAASMIKAKANLTSASYLFGKCKTMKEAKEAYEYLKNSRLCRDTIERHYFRAKQRLLLGSVMVEDLSQDRLRQLSPSVNRAFSSLRG